MVLTSYDYRTTCLNPFLQLKAVNLYSVVHFEIDINNNDNTDMMIAKNNSIEYQNERARYLSASVVP